MTVENLLDTGAVVPTTWRRTAHRIGKRGRIVGCTRFVVRYVASDAGVLTTDGRTLNCRGYGRIKVEVGQVPAVDIEAVDEQLLGFDLLFGIDAIKELGGVYLTK